MRKIRPFLRDRLGAELGEYAVAAAFLVAVALAVYAGLGSSVYDSMITTTETAAEAPNDPLGEPGSKKPKKPKKDKERPQ